MTTGGKTSRTVFLGGIAKVTDLKTLKLPDLPRIVFAGRSNVGKSSLLNALTGAKVARVSAEPGKTREINFYRWDRSRLNDDRNACVLVDLPGYGYAKVARALREQWGREITNWLGQDQQIALVVALADGRHGLLANDVELLGLVTGLRLPVVVAFTKMDKWKSNNQRKQAERDLQKVAANAGVERAIFVSSEESGGVRGLEELLLEMKTGIRKS